VAQEVAARLLAWDDVSWDAASDVARVREVVGDWSAAVQEPAVKSEAPA